MSIFELTPTRLTRVFSFDDSDGWVELTILYNRPDPSAPGVFPLRYWRVFCGDMRLPISKANKAQTRQFEKLLGELNKPALVKSDSYGWLVVYPIRS